LEGAGLLNKQNAAELGAALRTIKTHRGRVMHKLGVNSVAELVRLAQKVGIAPRLRRPGLISRGAVRHWWHTAAAVSEIRHNNDPCRKTGPELHQGAIAGSEKSCQDAHTKTNFHRVALSLALTGFAAMALTAEADKPAGMVWIPGGAFLMGSELPGSSVNEKPVLKVSVDGFWLDEHDVTNAEFHRKLSSQRPPRHAAGYRHGPHRISLRHVCGPAAAANCEDNQNQLA
jgi:formylglycine-generating enzyme required for sulfatase activity